MFEIHRSMFTYHGECQHHLSIRRRLISFARNLEICKQFFSSPSSNIDLSCTFTFELANEWLSSRRAAQISEKWLASDHQIIVVISVLRQNYRKKTLLKSDHSVCEADHNPIGNGLKAAVARSPTIHFHCKLFPGTLSLCNQNIRDCCEKWICTAKNCAILKMFADSNQWPKHPVQIS